MQRLGKNHDGYHGETIDIHTVLRDIRTAALNRGWVAEPFHAQGDFNWSVLRRLPRGTEAGRLCHFCHISAGTHGDEPAGPLAVLKLLQEDRWPENLGVCLIPCMNPVGFTRNQRTNGDGIDLNRDYRHPQAAETRRHIAWLERQPSFELYLCLHEDWEANGFYLYETNPDDRPSLAEAIIEAVKVVCPVDLADNIEGRPARGGIIRPKISPEERMDWPEGLYHVTHQSRQGYTLEAPSDFPLEVRVNALVAAVNAALVARAAFDLPKLTAE